MAETKYDISEALGVMLQQQDRSAKWMEAQTGIKWKHINDFRYGKLAASMEVIEKMCAAFDIPVEAFMEMCVERTYQTHNRGKYNNGRGCAIGVDPDYISDYPIRTAEGRWRQ